MCLILSNSSWFLLRGGQDLYGEKWKGQKNFLRVSMLDAILNDCRKSARAAPPVRGSDAPLLHRVREGERDETRSFPKLGRGLDGVEGDLEGLEKDV